MIEVVAGHSPRNTWIPLSDQFAVSIAKRFQLCIDASLSAALSNFCVELRIIDPSDSHLCAVVEKNVHREDVLSSLARHLCVNTTGVVAQHPAERAMVVSRGVWPPSERVGLGRVAKCVANGAGLNASIFLLGIKFDDMVHVFRPVDDNGNVAAL